ncbi:MAG TPA: hypothetical protein VHB51_01630 [Candidatus Saccharimonadales bacterium]|nr:hypothetical protein [Candidatus Saccharimonadales bacterium]
MSYADLAAKLGFAAGDEVYVESTPAWYSDFADAASLELTPGLPATHVHLFCDSRADLERFLKDENISEIEKSLWLSWPKQASGVKTDIGEQDLRDALLPLGWVDTKVAAIDDKWSGLKFLRRKN